MMFKPFYKYFNVNLLSQEAGVHNQKVYKNLNGKVCHTLSVEEKKKFIDALKQPTQEMFNKFGIKIDFKG